MRKKIIAVSLILTLSLVAVLMCACGDNDAGDKQLSSDKEIESFIKGAHSATISVITSYTNENGETSIRNHSVIKITKNGITESRLSGDNQFTYTVIYDEGVLYQFVTKDNEDRYSAQRISEEELRNINFTLLVDGSSAQSIASFVEYFNIKSAEDYLRAQLTVSDDYVLPEGLQSERSYTIKNNVLSGNAKLWSNNQAYIENIIEVCNINATELDIPEQYKNYKSLDLTE